MTTYTFGSFKISWTSIDKDGKPVDFKTEGFAMPTSITPAEDDGGGWEFMWGNFDGAFMTLYINERERQNAMATGEDASDYVPNLSTNVPVPEEDQEEVGDDEIYQSYNEDEFEKNADAIAADIAKFFMIAAEDAEDDEDDDAEDDEDD